MGATEVIGTDGGLPPNTDGFAFRYARSQTRRYVRKSLDAAAAASEEGRIFAVLEAAAGARLLQFAAAGRAACDEAWFAGTGL